MRCLAPETCKRQSSCVAHADLPCGRGGTIALDIARGLHFLHSKAPPVVHMDLKSPNIMLTRHGVAKLGDVGLARILNRTYLTVGEHIGACAQGL
jgi:serine/threonine protein kinase